MTVARGEMVAWDLERGVERWRLALSLGEDDVADAAVGRDVVVVATFGGTVRMWVGLDRVGGPQPTMNHVKEDEGVLVCGVDVSRDGDVVVTACSNGAVSVWSTPEAKPTRLRVLRSGGAWGAAATCVALSEGAERVVVGSEDYTIRVWDLSSCKNTSKSGEREPEARVLVGHVDPVRTVKWCGTNRVVSSSSDLTVRVWSLSSSGSGATTIDETGTAVVPETGAEAKAEAEETFSGCGYVESLGVAKSKWMAMASWMSADVFVRKVGCGARGGERSVVLAHDECALAVAVSEDGKDVVVMLRDGRVVAWRGTREVERGTLAMVGRRRRGDGTTREEETAARRFVVRVDGDHAVWSRVVGFLGWSS